MKIIVPKAIIFDWDETIVHGWPVIREAMNTVLVRMGKEKWEDSKVRECLHNSGKGIFRELFANRAEEAEAIYLQAVADNTDKVILQPQAEQTFKYLQSLNIYMAVVSNKRSHILNKEIAHFGFGKYFSKIVGAGDAEKDKPAIESVLMALDGLKAGSDVWFIGDSMSDLQCAKNAGLTAILIETNLPPEDKIAAFPPAARVKNHAELQKIINDVFAVNGG